MRQLKKIDLDEIWQKEQGWNAKKKSGRKFDDEVELRFWEGACSALCRAVQSLS